jgi:hypothetical protein
MSSNLPPAAGLLYLEQRWWGWRVQGTVGPNSTTRIVLGPQKRAIRIGHQLVALLLEAQRRARANGGA